MKNLRKKNVEVNIIEKWKNYKVKQNRQLIILSVFFEIFDMLEYTNHLKCIERLYLSIDSGHTHFETCAQDLNVDSSTLRRYRNKYIKIINYLATCSEGTHTFKLLKALSET